MKEPVLKKKRQNKKFHGYDLIDYYSWVHQDNILGVLSNPLLLDEEVREYLEKENKYAEKYFGNKSKLQKKLFKEIKSRIKLSDKSLPFRDKKYDYWTKTTTKSNYFIKLRKKIGSQKEEVIWNGDKEKLKLNSSYFGLGDISISNNDKYMAYSLDTKGSEYYTINFRNLSTGKDLKDKIYNTTGSITFTYDNKHIFYCSLDKNHRSKKVFLHKLGDNQKKDKLIYSEKIDRFSVSIHTTSDEKYYIISSGDHSSNKCYYISSKSMLKRPKIFLDLKEGINYSLDSWDNHFYLHTNYKAENFKIMRCEHGTKKFVTVVPKKKDTIIGSYLILKNWFIWKESEKANSKIIVRNLKSQKTQEINLFKDKIKSISVSLYEKNKASNLIYLSISSPKNPSKTYIYDLKTQKKKLIKKQIIPSGFNEDNYITERLFVPSKDKRQIPVTIIRHKKTKLDASAKVLLYGYGSYGSSLGNGFSSAKYSLIDRGIIWANAHIRGGMECGMRWWKEGKMLKKKNTFEDYIDVAQYLISKKYVAKGNIFGMGGSAGGLLMGAVINMKPQLFLGAILAVPFVDCLTTNLDHSLPLTVGEFKEFGNAKKYKKHFEYIKSYSPYNNIKKQRYPHMLITTSLFDNRVLFDEPTKYVAKLRQYKTDDNILLLKTEMEGGHGGKTGRDSGIDELAIDYTFILDICGINK